MKNNLLVAVACLSSFVISAQTSVKWKAGFEPRRVFIENKSQFDGRNNLHGSEILFATAESPVMIYFTKSGLSYSLTKTEVIRKSEEEIQEERLKGESEEEEHESVVTKDVVHLQWENSNPAVQVIPMEKEAFYYSYAVGEKHVNHVQAFKKLLYKELYPHIDVEYIFPPQGGIEYSVILHPGADVLMVKMKYTLNGELSIDNDGFVHLPTLFGDIVDHSPVTAYQTADNATIPSQFIRTGNTISFKLGAYDNAQTVIIDPWVTTPNMPTSNKSFYIKTDLKGNAYVYGGDSPFLLQKYDTSGAMLWSYNTGFNSWFGTLAVDRTGNSYITDGSAVTLAKIDSAGGFVWSNNTADPIYAIEYWAADFNCAQTELYIGGSRHPVTAFSFQGAVFKMNLTDGSVSSLLPISRSAFIVPPAANEVRSMCIAPNGKIYYLTLDTIGILATSFTGNTGQKSTYHFPYYLPYSYGGGQGQGQNNIRASTQFLYSTNGQTLHKRSLANGNVIATVTIPFGSANNNSGIAIDSCENVFVGSQNRVLKYDANLNLLDSALTPEPVYDISIGANGDVLACGHNYAVALAMNACPQYVPDCCSASATITSNKSVICSGDSAHICANSGMATYHWNTGETTPCIDAKLAGNYYVTVSDGGSCTATSNHLSLAVHPLPPVSISVNGDTLTAYNSTTYQWYLNGNVIAGATSSMYIAQQSGDYTVAVSDTNGCFATSTKVTITTGIEDLAAGESFAVYPNPLESGRWNLACSKNFIGSKIEIFDSNGRLVHKSEIKTVKSEIDLDAASGVYMMRVSSEGKNVTLKLIRF